MSINRIMNTGLKGMIASTLATNVTSSNIANSATVGYTRRSSNIYPDQAMTTNDEIGRRIVEPFIQKRLLNAQSTAGDAKAQHAALGTLDEVFSEGDGNLGSALDAFQAAVQSLTARPDDTSTRQAVLAQGTNLATAFQNASARLNQERTDSNGRVDQGLKTVNEKLTQIGKIGEEIQRVELDGHEASDLRDQRDQLIKDVAGYVPVSVIDQGNGRVSVMLGGAYEIVSPDGLAAQFSSKAGNDGGLRVHMVVAGADTDVTAQVNSGSIGGEIKVRAGVLADAQQKLDQLAYDTATAYNQVHTVGVGLDGVSGRNLFEPLAVVSGAAASFAISADVEGAPEKIAAALDATTLPSDNRNAMALAQVATAPLALGGMTVTEALASLTGFAGTAVQASAQQETFTAAALEQVQALQENSAGVNTDEEMVNLMRYQRAYQGMLKVISAADQMLSDLLDIR